MCPAAGKIGGHSHSGEEHIRIWLSVYPAYTASNSAFRCTVVMYTRCKVACVRKLIAALLAATGKGK